MYGSKDFATEAWIKKVEKVVPDSESWFYGAYAHLAIAVAAGTNNAAILKLQTSLREKGVAESVCNVERMATVPLNADYSPEKGLARTTEKTKTTTLQTTLQATLQTTLQGTSLKIAQMMLSRPEIKIDEIASAVGLTRDGVNYQIRRLKKLVGLRHDGADQSGRWVFASNAIDERQ